MSEPKQCTWNGITYQSIAEAARAAGVHYQTMYMRFRNGYTCDSDLKHPRKLFFEWNGKRYKSIAAAAKANHCTEAGMRYRLKRGYASDKELGYEKVF